ncbi:MAG: hypothetical protein A2845_04600 [Candidatus Lloydbacteria bacterium RIFCSPHIGHO2_01_FULL_49_22]|uniref:Uncharacterized protein n=1 Tax=Candidatus Lloydbacteria bacterium RIFCSPHIGHO2_01_FULL_49_22 TaxID=1798658 RepID=A0A1G2CW84_9BACT|nr:MAG: hypothetical protein A2845_04600 [Candidatus Lloydbacteria bacterium RIFCSPHIGHO2_01_FULL_49_22]OGZ10097.1 MAG: hypothetical protein A3C14_00635 [Candidatus Lloydbacteria bacterium RIFCSPHIGHO2_02_FULL_50_18]
MKKIAVLFLSAFLLNVVWENLHSFLYESYQGGTITEFILLRASLFDAIVVMLFVTPFLYVAYLKKRTWLIIVMGALIAITNEWYGLSTDRWSYNSLMPILPFLHTGLTPTLQLGLLGYLVFRVQQDILND